MNEELISQVLNHNKAEKTSIDKLLSKEDIKRMVELSRKDKLERSDILELLSLCISSESKLTNLSEWDRYYVLKIFVWLRQIINRALHVYDYDALIKQNEALGIIKISSTFKSINERNRRLAEYNAKFMIDLYLNIMRTSLSVGGAAFTELLRNKHEIVYNESNKLMLPEQQKKGLFS